MHYYQHHIGDFIKDTSFLTNEEVGIYLKLLWLYYDTEQPLPNSMFELSMKVNARDQQDALSGILEMFFTLENDQWHHSRCDKEIEHYHQQLETASKAGKASAAKRALNKKLTTVEQPLDVGSTNVQPTNNHKPITNNQEPKKKPANAGVSCPAEVETKVWEDWLQIRKAKKLPLTDTAWQQMTLEAGKAGVTLDAMIRECCLRNWASFKADWYEKEKKAAPTFVEQRKQTLSGLTRGLLGGDGNVKLLGN